MSVDADTVRRIAHLARIAVAESEVENLKGELNAMLATYLPASGQVGAGGPEQAESAADAMAARVRSFIVDIEESI
jgi:aspartyl-tRNA(Asn)/glutamyl-tRNA(Gln) amidotransferase subunit C